MVAVRGRALIASAGALAMLAFGAAQTASAAPAQEPAPVVAETDTCRAQDDEILEKADIKLAERSLLCLVNVHRVEEGVSPVPWDPSLSASAREHSNDMVERQFYDHVNPDGETASQRAKRHGYPGDVFENIYMRGTASGVSPMQFFLGWEADRLNDDVMLSAANRAAGLGFAIGTPTGDPGATGTQVFGLEKTGAKYLALDMLIPAECPPAREALRKAKQKLAAAKEGGKGVAKAKKHVRKRKAAVRAACEPTHF